MITTMTPRFTTRNPDRPHVLLARCGLRRGRAGLLHEPDAEVQRRPTRRLLIKRDWRRVNPREPVALLRIDPSDELGIHFAPAIRRGG
jgi:hypothetical protein